MCVLWATEAFGKELLLHVEDFHVRSYQNKTTIGILDASESKNIAVMYIDDKRSWVRSVLTSKMKIDTGIQR